MIYLRRCQTAVPQSALPKSLQTNNHSKKSWEEHEIPTLPLILRGIDISRSEDQGVGAENNFGQSLTQEYRAWTKQREGEGVPQMT